MVSTDSLKPDKGINQMNNQLAQAVLNDYAASDFLKFTIRKLQTRDSVDAANDVEILNAIFCKVSI